MDESNSDISEVSELEYYSVKSHDSSSTDDSEITSYNSADETISTSTNHVSSESTDKYEINIQYTPIKNLSSLISTQSCPTTEDIMSSEIFRELDSSTKCNDIKVRFNEYVQFFSELSTKNNVNKSWHGDVNGIRNSSTNSKYQYTQQQSMNKSTWAQSNTPVNVYVQTDSFLNSEECNTLFVEQSIIEENGKVCSLDIVTNGGDSLNSVTATATSVVSLVNDNGINNTFTSSSSSKSDDFELAAIKASSESISLVLTDLAKNYGCLFQSDDFVIELSTICNINKTTENNSCNSIVKHQSPVTYNPIVDLSNVSAVFVPQITHISDSSTNSSTTDDYLPENSRIFVATPFTITSIMSEESHPIPPVLPSSICQNNGSNLDVNSLEMLNSDANIVCSIAEQNIEYSRILQNTFFRTSTPLLGAGYKRKCISNINVFPSSSFIKSRSFKDLKSEPLVNIYFSKYLDYRQNNTIQSVGNNNVKSINKRAFLSLYNLTCPQLSGSKDLQSQSINPTNIFFTNSRSYGSLKETDLDTGKEKSKEIYKETDLDKYSKIQKCINVKAKSLNNICKLSNENGLVLCDDLDENILDTLPNSTSVSLKTNLLYTHLREKAKTPAQLRVAKSITKLNVPDWMSSVEFSAKKPSDRLNHISVRQHDKQSPTNGRKMPMASRKPRTLTPPKQNVEKRESKDFSLPSTKYHSPEIKLKPIIMSRARQALNQYRTLADDNLLTNNFRSAMADLSKEFLTHLNHKEGDLENVSVFSAKDAQICSRSLCSKELRTGHRKHVTCDECLTVYCSCKCLKEDKKSHIIACKLDILKRKMKFLLDRLSKIQISLLAHIFELGQSYLGKGFIYWNVENDPNKKSTRVSLPKYMLISDAQKYDITAKVQEIGDQEFLCVLTSKESSSNVLIVLTRVFKRYSVEVLSSPSVSPVKMLKMSNLCGSEREKLFNKIVSMLHSYKIDIQEKYPAIYFKLVEYVMNGCWFPKQTIVISDSEHSGLPIKLIIEPDQLPLQIKI